MGNTGKARPFQWPPSDGQGGPAVTSGRPAGFPKAPARAPPPRSLTSASRPRRQLPVPSRGRRWFILFNTGDPPHSRASSLRPGLLAHMPVYPQIHSHRAWGAVWTCAGGRHRSRWRTHPQLTHARRGASVGPYSAPRRCICPLCPRPRPHLRHCPLLCGHTAHAHAGVLGLAGPHTGDPPTITETFLLSPEARGEGPASSSFWGPWPAWAVAASL